MSSRRLRMSSMSDGDTLRVVRRFFGGRLAVGISPVSMCLPNSRINWFECRRDGGSDAERLSPCVLRASFSAADSPGYC
jgi:hypothetical protein